MAYLALYREWRPKFFRQVAGQDHIVRTLQNALREGHVAHAYLFCGPKGTGKTTTAKVLARALNCARPQGGVEPCGDCDNCLDIDAGTSMDVIEIDAASNRGIDEVRDLREKIKFSPTSGSKRVYIIDEAHMMTEPAFNALLKTLEEPPAHAVFILATTEPHKMPLTILSRCQRFEFHRISDVVMGERLREVARGSGIIIEEKALGLVVKASDGGLRDALSVLDQASSFAGGVITPEAIHSLLGTVQEELLESISLALRLGNAGDCIETVAELVSRGKDLRLLAGDLTSYLRDVLVSSLGTQIEPAGSKGDASFSEIRWEPQRLTGVLEILARAEQDMRWSSHPRVILEVALVRSARHKAISGGVGEVRLEALEERLAAMEKRLGAAGPGSPGQQGLPRKKKELPGPREGYVQAAPSRVAPDRVTNNQVAREPMPFKPALPAGHETGAGSPLPAESSVVEVFKKIQRRWPDILEAVKNHPNVYHMLTGYKGWPLECKEDLLTVAFPGHPDPRMPISILEGNNELITDMIKAVCRVNVRVKFVTSNLVPPYIKVVQPEVTSEEGMALFDGEEELSGENIFDKDN